MHAWGQVGLATPGLTTKKAKAVDSERYKRLSHISQKFVSVFLRTALHVVKALPQNRALGMKQRPKTSADYSPARISHESNVPKSIAESCYNADLVRSIAFDMAGGWELHAHQQRESSRCHAGVTFMPSGRSKPLTGRARDKGLTSIRNLACTPKEFLRGNPNALRELLRAQLTVAQGW